MLALSAARRLLRPHGELLPPGLACVRAAGARGCSSDGAGPRNPLVYLDVGADNQPLGRVVLEVGRAGSAMVAGMAARKVTRGRGGGGSSGPRGVMGRVAVCSRGGQLLRAPLSLGSARLPPPRRIAMLAPCPCCHLSQAFYAGFSALGSVWFCPVAFLPVKQTVGLCGSAHAGGELGSRPAPPLRARGSAAHVRPVWAGGGGHPLGVLLRGRAKGQCARGRSKGTAGLGHAAGVGWLCRLCPYVLMGILVRFIRMFPK